MSIASSECVCVCVCVCVFVAFGIQHETRMCCNILSSVACRLYSIFSRYKDQDFREKHMCFDFLYQFSSETFLILRRN